MQGGLYLQINFVLVEKERERSWSSLLTELLCSHCSYFDKVWVCAWAFYFKWLVFETNY